MKDAHVAYARFEDLADTREDWTARDVLLGVLWDIDQSRNEGLSPIAVRNDESMPEPADIETDLAGGHATVVVPLPTGQRVRLIATMEEA